MYVCVLRDMVAVAVVVAFFICWAPFHAQRLMTIYIRDDQWTPLWLELQSHLFYISGRTIRRVFSMPAVNLTSRHWYTRIYHN